MLDTLVEYLYRWHSWQYIWSFEICMKIFWNSSSSCLTHKCKSRKKRLTDDLQLMPVQTTQIWNNNFIVLKKTKINKIKKCFLRECCTWAFVEYCVSVSSHCLEVEGFVSSLNLVTTSEFQCYKVRKICPGMKWASACNSWSVYLCPVVDSQCSHCCEPFLCQSVTQISK